MEIIAWAWLAWDKNVELSDRRKNGEPTQANLLPAIKKQFFRLPRTTGQCSRQGEVSAKKKS